VDVKKLTTLAIVLFIIFFIVTSPTTAATIVQNIWNGIVTIADGIGTFLQRLTGSSG
jgi:hypothetical protein